MDPLSHLDREGRARMVDVSDKEVTRRHAVAEAFVRLSDAHIAALKNNPKGDALAVSRIAGIQAGKRTAELIPLCHPLPLALVAVNLQVTDEGVVISAEATAEAKTGVEMEALTAASVAALTLYDMLKSAGPEMEIEKIRLVEKTGGKSDWTRKE
ncbi:MAG: cyclic pyranopterin monophosphate synthase MoaC [Armatimonadetes bacterium]|nr:cyclic pyranopterin monophosphate synthase MoaC [Armatimonadota bacterium]